MAVRRTAPIRSRAAALAVLVTTAAVAGCGSSDPRASITPREYARIEIGMTYPQVRRIAGGPGELTSSTSNAAGFRGAVYIWPGRADGSTIRVRFANGTVFSKSRSADR